MTETYEPLLDQANGRYTLYPIVHQNLLDFYKKAVASFWTVEEVDLSKDYEDFCKLTVDEQHFVSMVLAFFAASDGIVMENLSSRFSQDVTAIEARFFYAFQGAMEATHGEMYSILIETLIKSPSRKNEMLNAASTIPSITAKAAWSMKWIKNNESFAERLVAFAAVEGIFFSSSFCSIFWLKQRNLMPGLAFSNELISRDEGLHTDFACLLFGMLQHKPSDERVQEIIREAVDIEVEFVEASLPVGVIGLNATMMCDYVRFVADRLLTSLGVDKVYNIPRNPCGFMELISLQGKTNFFERRVGEYQKSGVMSKETKQLNFSNEDF